MGIADADSREHSTPSSNYIITPVSCPLPGAPGAPALSIADRVRFKAGSRLAAIYNRGDAHERYFCNYELNREYEPRLQAAGMLMAAFGPRGEPRAIELPEHRFFVATLFQPQLQSAADGKPHPFVMALLRAAADFKSERARTAARA
jgi:CTP synthase (UTP-ammonia lyase)